MKWSNIIIKLYGCIYQHRPVHLISIVLTWTQWRHDFTFCFQGLCHVVAEDGNLQNSECGNLSLILWSVLEKQNLYLWHLGSVGLCYCKWMHVVLTFKVHSNCLKTIKIQMSYLFIYTLQQEMKLQTRWSSGSGILPGSWGTGQSVPGCRGVT